MSLSKRGKYAALAVIPLIGAVALIASPPLRASFRAGFLAFRDPSLLRDPHAASSSEPPRDPPIDQPDLELGAGDETTLADGGLTGLAGFVMPDLGLKVTPRTLHFVTYFTTGDRGREAFATRFRRAGRYRRSIEQSLRDAELPEDLVWLCAIASGFEPQATSRKGATGLFQITPELGARYGLATSEIVDERRSLTRGTAVGATLLSDLFAAYGQWDLALAAYDLGRERLDEAIARLRERRGARDAKKPITLEDLAEARLVPKETANFVPQVQAFAIVAANRGRFGLDDLDPAAPLDVGEIAVPGGTPLRLIAKAAGVPLSVVRDDNPALLADRAPPGTGDVLVAIPEAKVSSALAAFPSLYAREMGKLADAGAATSSASAVASAGPSAGPSVAREVDPPRAPEPPALRITLASGVVIEQRQGRAGAATVGARVELVGGHGSFEVEPIAVDHGAIAPALDRVAEAVHALVTDGGDAAVAARRREGASRRQRLEHAPYGAAWLVVGDRLFPAKHPLAGTVLVAPTLPLTSVAISDLTLREDAHPLALTVTLAGADLRASSGLVERAFAHVFDGKTGPIPEPEREDRVELSEPVPATRVVFAWLAPSGTEAERAALRLAILAVAHNEVGKVARALVSERRVAAHVRGFLDLGDRASVVALEIVPAVPHSVAEVEAELDAAISALAEHGPSSPELIAAKAQHRARALGDQARAAGSAVARERLARLSALVDGMTAQDLAGAVKRAFAPGHRVVVVTTPRG